MTDTHGRHYTTIGVWNVRPLGQLQTDEWRATRLDFAHESAQTHTYTCAGQWIANNYPWVCAKYKWTAIWNPILYLSLKSVNTVSLKGVCIFKRQGIKQQMHFKFEGTVL